MNQLTKKLFPDVENIEQLKHQLITKKDLLDFSNALLTEIKQLQSAPEQTSKVLRSTEVRKLLKISPGTLQNLRINGTLKYSRVGGILYYKYDDLQNLIDK